MNIVQRIQALEGKHVESVVPNRPGQHFVGNWGFVRVLSVARSIESSSPTSTVLLAPQNQFLSGLHATRCPWGFLVKGDSSQIQVYLALPASGNVHNAWELRLASCFPGCEFSPVGNRLDLERQIASLDHVAALTGNPAVAASESTGSAVSAARLEALLRNMRGRQFAYLVVARPVKVEIIQESFNRLAAEERELVSNFQRRGSAEEQNHPQAKRCLELIRAACSNHELGLTIGMWDVQAHLRTRTAPDLFFGKQALHAALSGPGSRPQPIRVQSCSPQRSENAQSFYTRLNTNEAVTIAKLPEEELHGYRVREYVRFAVSGPIVGPSNGVDIGSVMDTGARTGNWFSVPLSDLTRHALVVGASGFGKTNTCQNLLVQLWKEYRIPWLVIEPSMKSEYRRLLRSSLAGDLRIFTLGDESGVPFRLNPLEVLPGIHVQTQIDSALSLFGAAFGWVSPMPEVLGLAVHRLYLNRGWDLVQGTHPQGYSSDVQPTLGDLLRLIPSFVEELGYNAEISSTIRAGLTTRLSSLTSGGKGRMLDLGISTSFDQLLSQPAILELSAVGNDEEKAFLLGAILMRLAQYRQSTGLTDGRLQHVLLIEEAHRLLAATPPHTAADVGNPRAKAVETFCNLLAEIRAYGQGVIIADQIPSKLVPDLLKNVNLKIVHRLPAEDDRRLVGATMNLSPAHERFLSTLPTGQAVVFAEGRELACHLSIPNAGHQLRKPSSVPSKAEIIEHMKTKFNLPPSSHDQPTRFTHPQLVLPSCPGCLSTKCTMRTTILRTMVTEDLAPGFQQAITRGWDALWQFGLSTAGQISVSNKADVAFCLLLNIAALGKFDKPAIEEMRNQMNHRRVETITA
ncbi:MAG: hypothetical protein PCFJNLEI_02389 [Verrucomicrobiae bacterium]|nr:hypothetical protein [Verrucomicrobiae bacterium]